MLDFCPDVQGMRHASAGKGLGGSEVAFTLVMYCWQIICSPGLISLGVLVIKMPRP